LILAVSKRIGRPVLLGVLLSGAGILGRGDCRMIVLAKRYLVLILVRHEPGLGSLLS